MQAGEILYILFDISSSMNVNLVWREPVGDRAFLYGAVESMPGVIYLAVNKHCLTQYSTMDFEEEGK